MLTNVGIHFPTCMTGLSSVLLRTVFPSPLSSESQLVRGGEFETRH